IDETELRVRAHLGPDARLAVLLRRAVLPGVVAEFAAARNRVESPQTLAGPDVESPHVASHVPRGFHAAGGPVGRADDDDVADDQRRGIEPDVGADRI